MVQETGLPERGGLTRRDALKAGGVAAIGLAFSKPLSKRVEAQSTPFDYRTPIPDQSNVVTSDPSVPSTTGLAQTFMPTLGALTKVELTLSRTQTALSPIAIPIQIVATSSGAPDLNSPIGSPAFATVPAGDPTDDILTCFEFTLPLALSPGGLFAISLFGLNSIGWHKGTDYPAGQAFQSGVALAGVDLQFRTFGLP